jgi:hypothetical protein
MRCTYCTITYIAWVFGFQYLLLHTVFEKFYNPRFNPNKKHQTGLIGVKSHTFLILRS